MLLISIVENIFRRNDKPRAGFLLPSLDRGWRPGDLRKHEETHLQQWPGDVWLWGCGYHEFVWFNADINAQVPADAPGDNTDDDSNLIKAENILNRLLLCGNYENIIKNIFKYLNATQLACLQKVPLTKQTQ